MDLLGTRVANDLIELPNTKWLSQKVVNGFDNFPTSGSVGPEYLDIHARTPFALIPRTTAYADRDERQVIGDINGSEGPDRAVRRQDAILIRTDKEHFRV